MLVKKYMTQNPVTVTPDDHLDVAQSKMEKGRFRSLPVLQDGSLVGIVTDRDLGRHLGYLGSTKVNGAMTEAVMTVTSPAHRKPSAPRAGKFSP